MKPTAEELLEALAYLATQAEIDCPQEHRSKWLKDALNDAWDLINSKESSHGQYGEKI